MSIFLIFFSSAVHVSYTVFWKYKSPCDANASDLRSNVTTRLSRSSSFSSRLRRFFSYCVTFKSADRRERRTKCLFIHDVRDSQGERGLTHICRRPSDLRRWRYKRTRRPHYPSAVSLVRGFEILNEKYLLAWDIEWSTNLAVEPPTSKVSKFGHSFINFNFKRAAVSFLFMSKTVFLI